MSDWWNQPGNVAAQPAQPVTRSDRVCPWCSAVARMDSTTCPACGAVMAQRESLGGLVLPGVTSVDQDLADPTLTGSLVRSQTQMATLNALGASGGTGVQLVAAAGILARDAVGGILSTPNGASVGQPSEAAIEMARLLDRRAPAEPSVAERAVAEPAAESAVAERSVAETQAPEPPAEEPSPEI